LQKSRNEEVSTDFRPEMARTPEIINATLVGYRAGHANSGRRGPFSLGAPVQIPGVEEWWDHTKRGHQGLVDAIKRLYQKITSGSEEERCKAVREACHEKCVEYAMGHRVPGIGGVTGLATTDGA
jgi:hypothetical protein